jgi:glucose/arabinose dehydrogenase
VWLVALVLGAPALPARAQAMSDANLVVTPLGTPGLSSPTSMAFVAPNDILVLEKNTGRVRRVLNGALQASDVLDLAVNTSIDRGLLGIAVQTGTPARVFLYYTAAASDGGAAQANRIQRYDWAPAANGGLGALQNPQLVVDLPVTPGILHNGGAMLIDGQGRLYAVIGDVGSTGQLQNNPGGTAPDDTSVILRLNLDGTAAPGNPFAPYCSATTRPAPSTATARAARSAARRCGATMPTACATASAWRSTRSPARSGPPRTARAAWTRSTTWRPASTAAGRR